MLVLKINVYIYKLSKTFWDEGGSRLLGPPSDMALSLLFHCEKYVIRLDCIGIMMIDAVVVEIYG